jgi:glycosyltransferase involved in cell wall biosynthesis
MEAGDADVAHMVRRDLLTSEAASPDIVLNEARYEIEQGRHLRARVLLENAFGHDPEIMEARILLGIAVNGQDRPVALRLLEDAVHGSETEILWAVDALRGMGALRRAMDICDAALKRFPQSSTLRNRLGWLAEGVGDYEQALSMAEMGLHADAESRAQALGRLVRLHRRLGDRPSMIAHAAELLRLEVSPLQKLRLAFTLGHPHLVKSMVAVLGDAFRDGRLSENDAERAVTLLLDEGWVGFALHLRHKGFPVRPAVKRVLERRGLDSHGRRFEDAAAIRSPGILFPLDPQHDSAPMPLGWYPALRESDDILLVNSVLAAGGAERQFLMMARSLVAAGVAPARLHAAMFSVDRDRGHDHFEQALRDTGIHVHDLSQGDLSRLAMPERDMDLVALLPARLRGDVLALYQLAQKLQPAVLHGWQDRAAVAASLVGRMLDTRRIVLSARNMRPKSRGEDADWIVHSVYREALAAPSVAITANAEEAARDYEDWLGLTEGAISILPNAVDDAFIAQPNAGPTSPRRQDGPLRLVGVFRLAENKRPLLWLETVAALRHDHNIDLAPRIVGAGPLAEKVRRHADRLGLSDLHMDPPVQDPSGIYRQSDVLLLMSRVEGTPNVVLEAQGCGLPVAACRVGGVANALHRGGPSGGLLLEAEIDAPVAAAAIARWLPAALAADPGPRIDFIREHYSMYSLASRLLGLYGAPQ